jgi:hypothetical protein
MPNRVSVPVNVIVNFNGVSYDPGSNRWSGQPGWTVPQKTSVHPGDNDIVWTLRANNVPTGFQAQFASSNGVYFPSTSNWPGGPPTLQGNGTIVATDDYTGGAQPVDYYYGMNVVLQPVAGGNQTPGTFNFDPQVENEPGTISHA